MIEIYTKSGCGPCDSAKKALDFQNVKYQEYIVGKQVSEMSFKKLFPDVCVLPILVYNGIVSNSVGHILKIVNSMENVKNVI